MGSLNKKNSFAKVPQASGIGKMSSFPTSPELRSDDIAVLFPSRLPDEFVACGGFLTRLSLGREKSQIFRGDGPLLRNPCNLPFPHSVSAGGYNHLDDGKVTVRRGVIQPS
jgi:hypothetical protein